MLKPPRVCGAEWVQVITGEDPVQRETPKDDTGKRLKLTYCDGDGADSFPAASTAVTA
jgi:hypothetical protein